MGVKETETKTWTGKFISETRDEHNHAGIEYTPNLTLNAALEAEKNHQLSRIADALESLDNREHQREARDHVLT